MSEQRKRGAECSEHPTPQKTSKSTVTKTEGSGHYDTKVFRSEEGKRGRGIFPPKTSARISCEPHGYFLNPLKSSNSGRFLKTVASIRAISMI